MRWSILVLLLAALHGSGSAQQPPARDAVQRELRAAQGTWILVRYERQGKVWYRYAIRRDFKDHGRELQIRMEGDKLFLGDDQKPYRLRSGDQPHNLTFWLDPTATPKRCDLSFASGIFGPGMTTYEGIYRLQGDRLEICIAHHPEARPTKFTTGPDHEWLCLLVYQRVQPPTR